jgi:hypothetical protein
MEVKRLTAILTRWVVAMLIVVVGGAPVAAVPPPPVVPEAQAANVAMSELSRFEGDWAVEGTSPSPEGDVHVSASRQVKRVGDVLLIFYGSNSNIGLVDAIDFDPASASYRLIRPGLRNLGDLQAGPVIRLEAAKNMLRWEVPYSGPMKRYRSLRTTVSLEDGKWRERMEGIRQDGKAGFSTEYVFRRVNLR